MKENYDSQAVGQTQGAIPKQAATIPAGAIPVYANAGGIPVYYTMTLVQDQRCFKERMLIICIANHPCLREL